MDCKNFAPDFFNNVAAIAVVLLFTKVVMHRWRRGTRCRRPIAVLHFVTMLAAGAAIGVSLWATDNCDHGYHLLAWGCLAAAGLGFLIDILIEDVGSVWGWSISETDLQGTDSQ